MIVAIDAYRPIIETSCERLYKAYGVMIER
jgi:hypothetical protein